VATLAEH